MIKRLLKVVGFIIGFTLIQYLLVLLVSIISSLIYKGDIDSFLISQTFYNITLITTILFTLFLIFILSKKVKFKKIKCKDIIICFGIGIIFSLVFHLIRDFFFPIEKEPFNILVIIATGILGPILEEIMFRGLIYEYLKEEDKKQAMILTTILFALSHTGIINVLYAFILGIILIYLKDKYKSINASISFHIGVNVIAILFTNLI